MIFLRIVILVYLELGDDVDNAVEIAADIVADDSAGSAADDVAGTVAGDAVVEIAADTEEVDAAAYDEVVEHHPPADAAEVVEHHHPEVVERVVHHHPVHLAHLGHRQDRQAGAGLDPWVPERRVEHPGHPEHHEQPHLQVE